MVALLFGAAQAASPDASPAPGPAGYPARPIRLIVPFPPGGSTDILARALGEKLSQGLAQPVVIDNRPGAGGSIGAEAAARAAPDGYTLMMGHLGTLAVNPAIYKNLPYDPVKSFAPVSLMAIVPSVLVVNPSLPVASAAELIAYAKAHPGKLAYGSAGNGSTSHLTTEYFKLVTGTDILHVPYKGVGPMLTDLVSGQLSMGLNGAPAVMAHVNAEGCARSRSRASSAWRPCLRSRPSTRRACAGSTPPAGTAWSYRPARRSRSWRGSTQRSAERCKPRSCARASTTKALCPRREHPKSLPRSSGPRSRAGPRC